MLSVYEFFVINGFMKIRQNFGFTLIELMVATLVLAVLLGIAYPSFQTIIQNSRLDNAARNMFQVFNTARQEALTSGQRGFVCRSTVDPIDSANPLCRNDDLGNWGFALIGYRSLPNMIVAAPDNSFDNQRINSGSFPNTTAEERQQMVFRASNFLDNGVEYTSNSDQSVLVFNGDGTMRNDSPFRIAICDSRGEAEGQYIEINAVGRIFLRNIPGSTVTCDNP